MKVSSLNLLLLLIVFLISCLLLVAQGKEDQTNEMVVGSANTSNIVSPILAKLTENGIIRLFNIYSCLNFILVQYCRGKLSVMGRVVVQGSAEMARLLLLMGRKRVLV